MNMKKEKVISSGTVQQSTLALAGRWDANYLLKLKAWLVARGLDESEDNVRAAIAALKKTRRR